MNYRPFTEWSDRQPEQEHSGCVEGEYVNDEGRVTTACIRLVHRSDGPVWGHATGDWRDGTYKMHHSKYSRWRFTGPEVPTPVSQRKAIIVWSFYDAPGELRSLSRHGGDEDWVALVPYDVERPSWTESGTAFGCCDVSEHQLIDGRWVYIGAHA